jgi:polar amino acid transport system substrate-binding protein
MLHNRGGLGRQGMICGLVALSLALAACGGTQSTTPNVSTTAGDVSGTSAKLPADIRQRRTLRVGASIAYAPVIFYKTGTREVTGLDHDIADAVGKQLGVKVDWVDSQFDGIIPALKAGRFDLIVSGMSDTKERQQQIDFVDYFNAGTGILLKKDAPDRFKTLADLCGQTIAVIKGSLNVDLAREQSTQCRREGHGTIKLLTFDRDTDAIQQVKIGRAIADLNDYPVAVYNAQQSGGGNDFRVAGTQIKPGPYGIGIPKDQRQLQSAIQWALGRMISDGTYAEILAKWGLTAGAVPTAAINGGK